MFTDTKSIFSSKTFWGAAMTLAAAALKTAGFDFGLEDQAAMVNGILTVVEFIGSAMAIYGRVTATAKIG